MWARNLGPAADLRLMRAYPGRRPYYLDHDGLTPIDAGRIRLQVPEPAVQFAVPPNRRQLERRGRRYLARSRVLWRRGDEAGALRLARLAFNASLGAVNTRIEVRAGNRIFALTRELVAGGGT